MSDLAPSSYDEMPYIEAVFAQTHPDRLATLAKLFGISTPGLETCRVLELGCASGSNLIPMALGMPSATFVGIDLSARQIGQGQQTVKALDLENIELRHGNIVDIGAAWGQFDYIICHGIYSWVPEAIREKILDICRENLAPTGVAFVSYNTLPGWHMKGMVRDMMSFHASQFQDAPTKVRQARALLDFLAQSIPANTAYGMTLKQVLDTIRPEADAYLFHEYLEDVNEPVYFRQFAEAAARHGLQYLSEADFGSSLIWNLPKQVGETLRRIASDLIRMEQYMDFVLNRPFRQSLLIHQGIAIKRNLDAEVLKGLDVASTAKHVSKQPSLAQGVTEAFRAANGATATPSNAITKAALLLLAEQWPASLTYEQLLVDCRAKVQGNSNVIPDDATLAQQATVLGNELLQCYAAGVVELRMRPIPLSVTPSARPMASPLARLQAGRNDRVTNLCHSAVQFDELLRRLLCLLDGTRDREAIIAALVLQNTLAMPGLRQPGELPGQGPDFEKAFRAGLDEGLSTLAKAAVLMA